MFMNQEYKNRCVLILSVKKGIFRGINNDGSLKLEIDFRKLKNIYNGSIDL